MSLVICNLGKVTQVRVKTAALVLEVQQTQFTTMDGFNRNTLFARIRVQTFSFGVCALWVLCANPPGYWGGRLFLPPSTPHTLLVNKHQVFCPFRACFW